MKKKKNVKKNVTMFNLQMGDLRVSKWLSSQSNRARIVENAIAFCLSAGAGSEAYTALFLPASDRAPWPAKNGGTKRPGPTAAAPPAPAQGGKYLGNQVLGDFAPPRAKTPSAAGDFK